MQLSVTFPEESRGSLFILFHTLFANKNGNESKIAIDIVMNNRWLAIVSCLMALQGNKQPSPH